MGFGMALALVIVAQQIITVDLSPVSDQSLWLGKFVAWSFYWVLFGVVQSAMIGFLYYVREDREDREDREVEQENMQVGESAGEERTSLTDNQDKGIGWDSFSKFSLHPCLKKDFFLYTTSLRKFDMLSLLFAVVTYSTFIAAMLISVHTGKWLVDEPTVFHEGKYPEYVYYDSNDPNS